METQGNFDMATITQMLQSFGISPTQLGPERLATLQRLAANISDPSKVVVRGITADHEYARCVGPRSAKSESKDQKDRAERTLWL